MVHHERQIPRGARRMQWMLRGTFGGALFIGIALSACRIVIGIDDLSVINVSGFDGAADAPTEGDGRPQGDGRTEGDARVDTAPDSGPEPFAGCTELGRQQCESCCETGQFADEWARLVTTYRQDCICGPGASCGPSCAARPECPGSPAGPAPTTEEACTTCIEGAVLGATATCVSKTAACNADPGCALALRCLQSCK
jgi:hypothetical protein